MLERNGNFQLQSENNRKNKNVERILLKNKKERRVQKGT